MAGERIAIVRYDPEWTRRFEVERALLERVLAPWLEEGIHHVGATAIPGSLQTDHRHGGRSARPEEARAAFELLREQSYLYTPHRPGIAHHFAKPSLRLSEMTHGVHLTQPGSDLWANGSRSAMRCVVIPRWSLSMRR